LWRVPFVRASHSQLDFLATHNMDTLQPKCH